MKTYIDELVEKEREDHLMRILNLHGLGGSFDNTNYRMIRNASPSAEVVSETIDYENTSPKASVEKYCHYGEFDIVVGNSFGGFFAYVIGTRLKIKTLLINPCVPPADYIPKMVEGYRYTSELEELWNIYQYKNYNCFVLIGQNDEILDVDITDRSLRANGVKINWVSGGHSLSSDDYEWWFESLISQRFEFYNDGRETEQKFEVNGIIYNISKVFSDHEKAISDFYNSDLAEEDKQLLENHVWACPSLVINEKGIILEICITDNHGYKGTMPCDISIEDYFSDEAYRKDHLYDFALGLFEELTGWLA